MSTHLLIETGHARRLAACDEPFANGQPGSDDIAEVTCRACLNLFPGADVAMSVSKGHVNYPHEPGRLYDCPACEDQCHCTPAVARGEETECIWGGHE